MATSTGNGPLSGDDPQRSATALTPLGRAHLPLSEQIADEIRAAILAGRYKPGERLMEEVLANEFGVSRNPVREALRQLSVAGFVDVVPRHGASVATLGVQSVRELFEVRSALEAVMARLASERITTAQLEILADLVAKGQRAVANEELDALPGLNTAFHNAIARAAGNSRLVALNETVRDTIQWVYARALRLRAIDSWKEHSELFEAIRARDATLAAHLALDHITRAETAYLAAMADHDGG
ncbi:MAG TPA: GntR family transcriptional regulator [Acidimicrobiia bacterium]|nr:GntR family transcriptional regulator [Acidimicrobiia bacterium]